MVLLHNNNQAYQFMFLIQMQFLCNPLKMLIRQSMHIYKLAYSHIYPISERIVRGRSSLDINFLESIGA